LPIATGLSDKIKGPKANGGKAWKQAYARATALVDQMTVEEKVSIVTGQIGRCAGNTGAVERLGLPALCAQDGPAGVRPATGKTQVRSSSQMLDLQMLIRDVAKIPSSQLVSLQRPLGISISSTIVLWLWDKNFTTWVS
jgi:hypothetical protein